MVRIKYLYRSEMSLPLCMHSVVSGGLQLSACQYCTRHLLPHSTHIPTYLEGHVGKVS